MRTIVAIVAFGVVGCGGAGGAAKPKGPAPVEASEAEAGAQDAIEEIYESLRRGDAEGIMPVLADPILVIGPGAQTIYTDKTAAIVALSDAFHGEGKHKIKSKDLEVHADAQGHAAYAIDKVTIDGETYVFAAVLTENDDLWAVSAVSLARPMKKKDDITAVDAVVPPADAKPANPDVMQLFDDAIGAREEAIDQLDDDALLLDRSCSITSSKDKISKHWIKPAKKPKKKKKKKKHHHDDDGDEDAPPPPPPSATLTPKGDAHVGVTPDGDLAWVVADVAVAEPDAEPVPMRFFYVYGRTGDGWHLVLAHEAAFAP
jgi:ketosteroid isomerase-like protein